MEEVEAIDSPVLLQSVLSTKQTPPEAFSENSDIVERVDRVWVRTETPAGCCGPITTQIASLSANDASILPFECAENLSPENQFNLQTSANDGNKFTVDNCTDQNKIDLDTENTRPTSDTNLQTDEFEKKIIMHYLEIR